MNDYTFNRRGFITAAAGVSGTTFLPKQSSAADSDLIGYNRKIPVTAPYDVVVCGGGLSGTAAALSAHREGLSVLLVEGQGQLGGMGTSGLVSHWLGGRTSDCKRWVVGGLFRSMAEEAEKQGVALIPIPDSTKKYQPHGWHQGQLGAGIPFDPYLMAHYLDGKITGAGIDFLLFTQAVDVIIERNRIQHVVIYNKSGLAAVPAKAVIDATGDADIALRSRCKIIKGREEDGLMTPGTLEFHVDNVDQDALSEYIHEHNSPRFREKIKELRAAGEWPFPFDIFICAQLTEKGTMFVNTSRLTGIDGTNGASVTEGMIRGREEILQLLEVMRKHFPGFAQVRLKAIAPLLGVRETRRIIGEAKLTVDDLVSGKEFEDTIGFTAYGWDLPDPKRPSYQPMTEKKVEKRKPVTPVPYRIMVPRPIQNLICPGRAVSVERDVLGPLRVMAPCFAMGEATGVAVQQVVRKNIAFRDVDVRILRTKLREYGAIVEWEN